jgi:hypothetical protein
MEAAYDASAAGSAIPEIWADDVLQLTPRRGMLSGIVNWHDDVKGKPGDILHLPTIATVTFGGATADQGATAQAPTTSSVPVTIAERIAEIDISRSVLEDAKPDLIDKLNQEIRDAYEWDIDGLVLGWMNTPKAGANTQGTLTTAVLGSVKLSGSIIARAMGSFRAGTHEAVALICHTSQEASLLQDTQFTDASHFGDSSIVKGGKVRNYLGIEILATPQAYSTGGTYKAFLVGANALHASDKRDFTMDMDYNVQTRVHYWVATGRWGGTIGSPKEVYEIDTVD